MHKGCRRDATDGQQHQEIRRGVMKRSIEGVLAAVIIIGFTLMACGKSFASGLQIFVKDKVLVNSSFIRLGDIATFRPPNDPRVGRFAAIRIAPCPPPGSSTTINHDFLIYRLASFLAKERDVKVKVPQSLRVTRAAQYVQRPRLLEIFNNYVNNHSPWSPGAVTIQRFRCPLRVVLPKGKLRWTVRHQGKTHWVGPLALTITFWVNGKPVTKVPVSGNLLVKQRFIKTRTKLVRGHVLRAEDVIVLEKLSDSFNESYLRDIRDVVGKQLLRTALKGQLLTRSMIREVPWVKRGQQVRILAESAHVRVVTTGKALEDGTQGDQIRVVNTNSGRQLLAIVKGPGMVVVQF